MHKGYKCVLKYIMKANIYNNKKPVNIDILQESFLETSFLLKAQNVNSITE